MHINYHHVQLAQSKSITHFPNISVSSCTLQQFGLLEKQHTKPQLLFHHHIIREIASLSDKGGYLYEALFSPS